ncbi:MAG: aspartate-semialdehyde dehydrogenase [Clostridia bacterium]|nr:aspartate-semialdehyde dehydrogenase [Clostridia bacterium]
MLNVAVVGATGAVGREMISAIFELGLPVSTMTLMSSARSSGTVVSTPLGDLTVAEAAPELFRGVDVAFFSAGASVSRELAPEAVRRGALVIDNSSAFRMDPTVPLIIPEVNMDAAKSHIGIIANPNCTTIITVTAVGPIHRRWGIGRMIVSTYQAVSGAGHWGMEALRQETESVLAGEDPKPSVMPYRTAPVHHQIAFNVVPQVDVFLEDGYTKEEHKTVDETRKILGDESLKISATTVRVPVFRSHSVSANVQTKEHAPIDQVRQVLQSAPGVVLVDDPANFSYPMPIHASGADPVEVGRLREDPSAPNAIWLWIVGDQLRKGAASNAVQIALALYGKQR